MGNADGEEEEVGIPPNVIQVMFSYVSSIGLLVEDMAIEIGRDRHLDLGIVLHWRWSKLRHFYETVARARHDDQIGQITAMEIAISRVLGPALGGKKPGNLPDFQYNDPFKEDPADRMYATPFWEAYEKANRVGKYKNLPPEPDPTQVSIWDDPPE